MKEEKVEGKLNELIKNFEAAEDRGHQKPANPAGKARDSHLKFQKNMDSLQETLNHLRLCIKYQLFDLEATRRENKCLRKMLNDRNLDDRNL